MAFVIKDRVKESSTTTGTGSFTLAGAENGFQTFAAIGDGNSTYYAVTDQSEFEVGIGTYTASGTVLSRDTVISSSNSGNKVNFGAGSKLLICTQPASKAILNDPNNKVTTGNNFPSHITFDAISNPSHGEGRFWYNNASKAMSYYSDDSGVVHEVGIEEHARVFNETGATINKGTPVFFSGTKTTGSTYIPTVAKGNATNVNKYKTEGMVAADIANGAYGYIITAGRLEGIDTSHLSLGQFFTGITDGATQTAAPVYPNFPMCLGFVVRSNASDGVVFVAQQNHSIKTFRVQMDQHIGGNLTIDGDLNVTGSQNTTSTSDVTAGAPFYRANEGDAIGDSNTTFTGSGLDDAFFAGHFTGSASTQYYVKIDNVSGAADTFSVSTDNFSSTITTGTAITGSEQMIHSADNISVKFGATTGHTLNDIWAGTAAPVNRDTGFFSNRNTGTSGVGYTHMGIFYDASESKWRLVDEYDPVPAGTINTGHSSYATGSLVANVEGAVTGNASTASALASARAIALDGDVTGTVNFNGAADVSITSTVVNDSHTHDTQYVKLSGSTMTGALVATTVTLGDWSITETAGGKLSFSHSGTVKATLDDTGTFSAANDILTDSSL